MYKNVLAQIINEASVTGMTPINRVKVRNVFSSMYSNMHPVRQIVMRAGSIFGSALIDACAHVDRNCMRINSDILFNFCKEMYMNWEYIFCNKFPWSEQAQENLQDACTAILKTANRNHLRPETLQYLQLATMMEAVSRCNECECGENCYCGEGCEKATRDKSKSRAEEPKVQRVKIHVSRKPCDGCGTPMVKVTVSTTKDANVNAQNAAAPGRQASPAEKVEEKDCEPVASPTMEAPLQLKNYKVKVCSISNGELTIAATSEEDALMIASGMKPTYDKSELWHNFKATGEHPHIEICGEYGDDVITRA